MKRNGYIWRPYELLNNIELQQAHELNSQEYEQNYELLKEAAERNDPKHQDYVLREKELNTKDEKFLREKALRRKHTAHRKWEAKHEMRELQAQGNVQEA